MTIDSPDKYVTGSITSLQSMFSMRSLSSVDHLPAEVPKCKPSYRSPVDNQHPKPTYRHAACALMSLLVAATFELLHSLQFPLNAFQPAPKEPRPVSKCRDLDLYRALSTITGDMNIKLGGASCVSDEVPDVRGVRPLKLPPAGRGTSKGNRRCFWSQRRSY